MKKKKNSAQFVFVHVTVGIQLAITIFIFVYTGNWLDTKYKTSPIFLAIGTVFGMAIGFYHLMKQIDGGKDGDEEEDEDERKSNKWN